MSLTMCQEDIDVKIAGNKPSDSLKIEDAFSFESDEFSKERANGNLARAKKLGELVADEFRRACSGGMPTIEEDDNNNNEMITQRVLLLSFTATVGFEKFCTGTVTARTAQTAFFDHLQQIAPDLYLNSADTGAFSFYFLAFRRGNEVDRRVGQTFAMLCAHDGDPIYQELGEALYCWFTAVVEEKAKQVNFEV